MSEPRRLIDTSTLSEVMKNRDDEIRKRARDYLGTYQRFTFSILTRFEILRGLHAKGATRQLEQFDALCSKSEVIPLEDAIVVRAAEIYGWLRNRGSLIDDMDILIAATAQCHRLSVITENANHFNRVPDLGVESWRSG